MKNSFLLSVLVSILFLSGVYAEDIHVGTATVDITPILPAAVDGQMSLRVATKAETPITANVLVLSTGAERSKEATVFVSCDLVTIPDEILAGVRQDLRKRLPDIDARKVIINATHTHTAAVVRDIYLIPKEVTQYDAYLRFLIGKLSDGIIEAWNKQQKASVSWGLGHAKVAYNRRATYGDGTAKMYGKTNLETFRAIEGYEDQSINSLFFWNEEGKLIATCVNVSSPAQIVESRSAVNADYWHPVRKKLRERFGKDLCVLGWIGAAGDQTPRPMYNLAAENRMIRLKNGEDVKLWKSSVDFRTDYYLDEISDRIVAAVESTYELVKNDKRKDIHVDHAVEQFELPMRIVTTEEYEEIKKLRNEDAGDPEKAVKFHRRINWNEEVLERYEKQKTTPRPMYPVEIHVLRIGDMVLCTNPFELFTAYGVQMKARSPAEQTFVLQLVGSGTYLPTEEAVHGGHYSAIVQSNRVGPEGGQILVEKTLQLINKLWTPTN